MMYCIRLCLGLPQEFSSMTGPIIRLSTLVCELLVSVPPTVAPKVSSTTTGDEKLDKSSVAMAVAVAASGQCRDR